MIFDEVKISVRAGDGGNGVASFRREKFVPFGGPDGGDGGRGGSVYLVADPEETGFLSFRHRRRFQANSGGNGTGQKKHGRAGAAFYVKVPPGTIVMAADGEVIADLDVPGKSVMVARGGAGGLGNTHFASPTNRAPRIAQKGEPGEERELRLELRLIADVGIVGYPNVGKSTFLAAVSRAQPKIGSYPFTTLEPNLGVATVGYRTMVLADIPGLIDGAHRGVGLGHEFLRHIVRTRLLIHILDGTSVDVLADYESVNSELLQFDPELAHKPQIVVVNKMDLPEVRERWPVLERRLEAIGRPVYAVSAAKGDALREVLETAVDMLPLAPAPVVSEPILRPVQSMQEITVVREEDTFRVTGRRPERLAAMADLQSPEAVALFWRALARMGVSRALKRSGVKPGDRVRIGSVELEWN